MVGKVGFGYLGGRFVRPFGRQISQRFMRTEEVIVNQPAVHNERRCIRPLHTPHNFSSGFQRRMEAFNQVGIVFHIERASLLMLGISAEC